MTLSRIRIFLAVFLFLIAVPWAGAQIIVGLEVDQQLYVMGESVAVEVTVFNRAGRDIILDGPGDQSWLAINLTNPAGQLISKVKSKKREKAVIVRAGEALKRKIRVNDYVEFDDYGNYGLTASVYFPEKRSFFASKRLRISITDGQVFWEQVVGVPQGTPGAGSYRKYQLMTYNSTERTELYARIRDDTGNFDYGTFSLGTIILYRDPQVTVDGENKLHALYMAAPRTYRHVIIDTAGKIISQKIYEEDGSNRPRMLVSQLGGVNIRGGFLKDSTTTPLLPEGEQKKQLIRNISERRIPGQ